MMGVARVIALASALLLILSPTGRTATLVRQKGPATLALRARAADGDRLHVRLSDVITADLTVETAAKPEVTIGAAAAGKDWTIAAKGTPAVRRLEDGRWRWSYTLYIEPNRKDELTLQLPPLKYRDGGDWKEVVWDPVLVVVTTTVSKADASLAKDIAGIEEVPPANVTWFMPVAVALSGVAACLALLVASRLLPRRRRQAVTVRPAEAAQRELQALRSALPSRQEDVEPFHTRLAGVVRTYVEHSCHVPARQRTSAEFLALLAERNLFTPEDRSALLEFFRRCDLGKFAPLHLGPDECEKTLALATAFIEKTAAYLDNATANREDRK